MILRFRTDRPGQTMQTQIRLLLQEQSDQGLHCLPFCLHLLHTLLSSKIPRVKLCHSNFRVITANFWVSEFLRYSPPMLRMNLNQLMRLWYFSSSVNFKHACAAIQRSKKSDFWSDPSFTSTLHVCEQGWPWQECADAQARLSIRWSPMWLKYHNLMSWLI